MATLNVKNFPDRLYRRLRQQSERHHRSIAQEVTQILSDALQPAEPLSILALRGLGKELWAGGGAEHVTKERDAWD
jgi:plasmid stability protein